MVSLRTHASAGWLEELALVLASQGIASEITPADEGLALWVAEENLYRAEQNLAEFEIENRAVAPELTSVHGPSMLGFNVAVLLWTFFGIANQPWFDRGTAVAERILSREPWRAVTALTLHADLAHVTGNALWLTLLLGVLAQQLGPGLAAWVALLGGVLGNFATALFFETNHRSVGASTAAFAVLGALSARTFMSRRTARDRRRPAWEAFAAALAFLGMMGTAPGTDVLAHLFGLAAGAAVAMFTPSVVPPWPRFVQALLVLTAAASVVGAWLLAWCGASGVHCS